MFDPAALAKDLLNQNFKYFGSFIRSYTLIKYETQYDPSQEIPVRVEIERHPIEAIFTEGIKGLDYNKQQDQVIGTLIFPSAQLPDNYIICNNHVFIDNQTGDEWKVIRVSSDPKPVVFEIGVQKDG